MKKRLLLLDGDIFAYQMATMAEEPVHWGDDLWTLHADANIAKERVRQYIDDLMENFNGDACIIPLSDKESGRINFRNEVYPPYKMHRLGTRLPMILWDIRAMLMDEYTCVIKPHLEGDDVLGILATHPSYHDRDVVVVSIDKDMYTIPCRYANTMAIKKRLDAGEIKTWDEGIVEVTREEADRFHMIQTLAGDPVDGYPGCPGYGMKRAAERIDAGVWLEPEVYVPNRGKNAGQQMVKWSVRTGSPSVWETVRTHYESVGLTEEDALRMARCARILRYGDWDEAKQKPILWEPGR